MTQIDRDKTWRFHNVSRIAIYWAMKLNRIQYFQKICFAGLAVLFISLYCYGALEHSRRVNLDRDKIDQSAYLSYAQNMYETDYNYTGGRNRMPVYPFLLSLIYDPDFSENEYFTRGKYFNIALSAAILPALFLLLAASFPLRLAVNLWLIATFTVFIFRAAYVQVELLFYFLNFCSFLLMYKLLIRPSWQLGIISGAVIGLTHLTKASILPGLLLFILFFLGKEIYLFCTHLQTKKRDLSNILAEAKGYLVSNLLSLILVILCFTVTIYPYISNSNRFFGHYFYNVNSTFYMWYDSWQEAKQGTRLYGDGKGWYQKCPRT
ncbi:hypothetical protein [Lyngbya aestuarii]|uniref:hypothetical protein n=1 Tax=Lyngbya aestuarii TaxID=118322 RepID=UPI00403DABA8